MMGNLSELWRLSSGVLALIERNVHLLGHGSLVAHNHGLERAKRLVRIYQHRVSHVIAYLQGKVISNKPELRHGTITTRSNWLETGIRIAVCLKNEGNECKYGLDRSHGHSPPQVQFSVTDGSQ